MSLRRESLGSASGRRPIAAAWLKLEHADFSAAIALRKAIEELGRPYSGVQEFLSSAGTDPEEEFKKARTAAQETASAIKMKTVNYHAATVVAHRLAQELAQVADRDAVNVDAVIEGLDKALPPDQDDDEVIRRVDREIREDKADRKPIEARALTSLKNIVREARESTRRLRRAASVLREQRRSGQQSREATYRKGRELQGKFKLAADEFRGLPGLWDSENQFADASARAAAELLDAHASAFDTGLVENPFHDSLELDRYRLAAADLDPRLPEVRWTALQKFADGPAGTWLDAFDAAVERREHRATQAILRVAERLAGSRNLASERDEAIAQAREALRNQHRRLQDELLTVMNYAPPGETSLDPLYQSLASIDASLLPRESGSDDALADGIVLDFPDAFGEIDKARRRVHEVKNRALGELEARLQEQVGRAPAETIKHLRDLIEDGDLITLSEELSLIERGQDIAILPPGSIVVEEFSRFLTNHGPGTLVDWHRGRSPTGGRADALIRKWQAVKTAPTELRRAFRDLFGELGFEPKGEAEAVTGLTPVARVRQFKIRTRVISDREFCSVARFGSEAEGQYRILLTAKDPKPNEIVTAVPEGDTGATLVFVPQWVGRDMRLQIASEARRLSRTFCLIDDALVAFLCDRDRIIHDLFGCGIPFAAASPYVTTPGSIPVEAFFGRTAELANISSRDGSCIVYGGRQLGKSVLLDHIEQRGGNAVDRIAVRLDCQDLTERRELLKLIEKKLHILTADRARGDILEAIESWLRGKGTALRSLNDIDVACYISGANAPKDVAALLTYLADRLRKAFPNFSPDQVKPQTYSVTVSFKGTGLDVDVVPILYDGDKDWYGNLVSQEDGSFLKTNIPYHLEFIRKRKAAQETHFAQVARLLKFWTRKLKNEHEGFRFKSFMVELVLAHIADAGADMSDYPEALQHFFTYIAKSDFRERIVFGDYYPPSSVGTITEPVKIIDPVNATNSVSRLYTAQQADAIVEAALDAGDAIDAALSAPTKGETVRYWQRVFGPSFQV